jgi:hypothetical protein
LLVTSSTPTDLRRLIITPPDPKVFRKYWSRIEGVLGKHLPQPWVGYDAYATFLSTGLPFHLPLSFEPVKAEALAKALEDVGCKVRSVPE